MLSENPLCFREGTPEDWPFVLNSWLKGYRDIARPPTPAWDKAAQLAIVAYDAQAVATGLPTSTQLHHQRAEADGALRQRYYLAHKAAIEAALKRGALLVAAAREDTSVILGYVLVEGAPGPGRTVHYLHVKAGVRRQGLGRELLLAAQVHGGRYTHRTPAAHHLAEQFSLTYHPEDFAPPALKGTP